MNKYIIRILFFFILFNNLNANEITDNLKIIDINFIINNSVAGKKMISDLDKENKIKLEELNKIENNLAENKSKLISQKNILNPDEYNKKVENHQLKVSDYQKRKKNVFEELNKKRLNLTNTLLKSLNDVLVAYANENSIDIIIKKESVLITQKNADITKIILEKLNKKIKSIN